MSYIILAVRTDRPRKVVAMHYLSTHVYENMEPPPCTTTRPYRHIVECCSRVTTFATLKGAKEYLAAIAKETPERYYVMSKRGAPDLGRPGSRRKALRMARATLNYD